VHDRRLCGLQNTIHYYTQSSSTRQLVGSRVPRHPARYARCAPRPAQPGVTPAARRRA
jgi:hypothetical protein